MSSEKIVGSAQEAINWVNNSALDEVVKTDLLNFIQKFPLLKYYKETNEYLTSIEKEQQIILPQWFKDIRQVCAYVTDNNRFLSVELDINGEPQNPDVYRIALIGNNNSERKLWEQQEDLWLWLIGENINDNAEVLAINLKDQNDSKIYQYNVQDLWDNYYDERPLSESISDIYPSYSAMLADVKKIY